MWLTDVNLSIAGYSGSTNVSSLSQAFSTLDIGAVLPGLKSSLLSSASLEGIYLIFFYYIFVYRSELFDSTQYDRAHK